MKLLLAGVALSSLCATALIAQDAPPPPPPPGLHGPGKAMKPITRAEVQAMVAAHFAELDANHDGKVTKAEFDADEARRRAEMDSRRAAHRDQEFTKLDANRDGALSKSEFDAPPPRPAGGPDRPPPPRGGPGMGPMRDHGMMMVGPRWFDRADANHDGAVTLAEAQTAVLAMFDRLDANHDGTITPDEMRAMWTRGPGGRGGPRGPGGDMPPPPQQ
ncbi:EF-hand domain-containing protein [Sphingomonas bacterium]|uniref:EF-hand domain-containing protein n=1 Tax=Sphingomonas bacterium TaxID=1895847 RepID=UPI001577036E|nr:EF-hand domain-containing protein [Sphingomonas bacterium]